MHLDEEQVERLRHGELAPAAEVSVREHLESCMACRAVAAEADRQERELLSALRALDHPVPAVSAQAIAARARHRGVRRARWTAVILTLALGGAAYAAPGSPVRSWVNAVTTGNRVRTEPTGARAVVAPPARAEAGIAVEPGASLVIAFGARRAVESPPGIMVVTLVDSAEVTLRAPRGAATFTTDAAQLAVEQWDPSATFEILVPRAAPHVEIRVGGQRVFLKEGRDIASPGIGAESGRYVISLATGTSSPR